MVVEVLRMVHNRHLKCVILEPPFTPIHNLSEG